jgi:hypothetical protein
MRILIIIYCFLLPQFVFAREVQVINTGKDFQIFWQSAEGKTFEEQEKLWTVFENKYREIYDTIVFDKSNPNWQNKRIDRLKWLFSRLPHIASNMNELFEHAEEISLRQAVRFKETFPDLHDGTPVVFLPGLTFDGKAQYLPSFGRTTLLIGVDLVADINESLDLLFSHEFFHIYHLELLKNKIIWQTFSTPLWIEGFATYASGILNPGSTVEKLLMNEKLSIECNNQKSIQAWSKDYLSFYDNRSIDMNTRNNLYKDWFLGSGESNPKRRGYCLGFRVIQNIASQNSIQDMVRWDEPTFILKVGEALNNLSK